MDEVPFDLRSYRVQIYETRFDRIHRLKQSLTEIAEKHKSGGVTFGSPVIDFYPETLETKGIDTIATAASEGYEEGGQDTPEVDEEKGGADYAADVEEALEEMTRFVNQIGEVNSEHTNKIAGYTAQLQMLNESPQPGHASKKRAVLAQSASEMNAWAKRLEQDLPGFERSIGTLGESFAALVNFIVEPSTEQDKAAIANASKTFSELAPQVHAGTESFRELQKTVAGLRGLSKEVNRASRRLAEAVGNVIQNMERVEAFVVRAVALIDDRFGTDDTNSDDVDA